MAMFRSTLLLFLFQNYLDFFLDVIIGYCSRKKHKQKTKNPQKLKRQWRRQLRKNQVHCCHRSSFKTEPCKLKVTSESDRGANGDGEQQHPSCAGNQA